MVTEKLSYTVDEAAAATGVSRSSLYERIKAGELPTFKWCGRTLIKASVLHDLIERLAGGRAA